MQRWWLGVGLGVATLAFAAPPRSDGGWGTVDPSRNSASAADKAALIEQLEAIGYVGGSVEAEALPVITVHDATRSAPGVNLYSSGHAPYAAVIGADGAVKHAWQVPFLTSFPKEAKLTDHRGAANWRRVHLLPDGSLLAVHEGIGLVKIDAASKVVWARRNNAHHDIEVLDDGTIMVLARKGRMMPELGGDKPVLEDFVLVLDANGHEQRRISVLDALTESPFAAMWRSDLPRQGDVFHSNALRVLTGSLQSTHPAFAKGNLLVSLRELDLVGVIDPKTERFVWAQQGPWQRQHDPRPLKDGRLMVFDNGLPTGSTSRALEYDLATGKIVWTYGATEGHPFHTKYLGASRRLGNGNTLVVESEYGRVVEVTRKGEVVWEFHNPHRAGDQDQYIGAVFDMERLSKSALGSWARAPK